jgi:hypothetical protein
MSLAMMMNHRHSIRTTRRSDEAFSDVDISDEAWTSFSDVNSFRPKTFPLDENRKMKGLIEAIQREYQDVNTLEDRIMTPLHHQQPILEVISSDDEDDDDEDVEQQDDRSRPPSVLNTSHEGGTFLSDDDSLTLSLDGSEAASSRRAERIRRLKDSFYDMMCNSCAPVHSFQRRHEVRYE